MRYKAGKRKCNKKSKKDSTVKLNYGYLLILASIIIVVIVAVAAVCIMTDVSKQSGTGTEPATTLTAEEAIELESKLSYKFTKQGMGDNVNLVYENGGSMTVYDNIVTYMTTYFELVFAGNYEKSYEYYATEFLEALGYLYSYDNYCHGIEDVMESLKGEEEGLDWKPAFFISHYVPYENYDIVYVTIEREVTGDNGKYYDNACTMAYTLIKDSNNEYKLLDIPYTDFKFFAAYKYEPINESESETDWVSDSLRTDNGATVLPGNINGLSEEEIESIKDSYYHYEINVNGK